MNFVVSGGEGNLVQVRNTVFSGNTGYRGTQEDYGAAIAFSHFASGRDTSTFPRHEITDW